MKRGVFHRGLLLIVILGTTFLSFSARSASAAASTSKFSGVLTTAAGQPIPNAAVTLGQAFNYTAADGSFVLEVAPGSYQLGINYNGGSGVPPFNLIDPTIDLSAGDVVQNLAIPFVTVNVTVLDGNGNPAAGANLSGGTAQGAISVLPGGSSTLFVHAQGGRTDANGKLSYLSVLGSGPTTGQLVASGGSPEAQVTIPPITTDPTNITLFLVPIPTAVALSS